MVRVDRHDYLGDCKLQWLPAECNNFMCSLWPADKIKTCLKFKSKLNTRNEEWQSTPVCTSTVGDSQPVAGGNSSVKRAGLMGLSEVGRKSKKRLKKKKEVVCGFHGLSQPRRASRACDTYSHTGPQTQKAPDFGVNALLSPSWILRNI